MLEGLKEYWLCVGGANVDVQGVTSTRLLSGTSNPGIVTQAAGGVARNVAENLARLGEEVHLFALVGEDSDGEWLRQTTAQSGVATHGMVRVPGESTGRYLAIRDLDGELYTAVADMKVNEAWTEEMVQKALQRLPQSSGLFLDANLPIAVLKTLLGEAIRLDKKVVVDPVSVKKAEKWRNMLEGVHLLITGIDELETLQDQSLQSFQDVERCSRRLVDEGIKQVMVICGEAGFCLCTQNESLWMSAPPIPIREAAGDAFVAGTIFAQSMTDSLAEQAAYGMALAELSKRKKTGEKYDLDLLLQRKSFFAAKAMHVVNRE